MTQTKPQAAGLNRRAVMQAATALAAVTAPAAAVTAASAEPQAPPAPPALGGGQPTAQLFWTTNTVTGKVMGMANGKVKEFKGIPYGAPTGGANRYMPPKKAKAWTGVKECFAYTSISPQTLSVLGSEYGMLIQWDRHVGGMGEDVLTVNIWTPTVDRGAKKAVMVSFHGGGWATGSGNAPGFDGAQLANAHDVVVVTVNHRLNTFGYLNLIDLGAPKDFQYAGTCGVMDMVASLEWVRDNIENFGGDPSRVMIFGQSGGGAKVSTLCGTPAAKGLFHRAAIQSGSTVRLPDKDAAAKNAEVLLKRLNIDKKNIGAIQKLAWQDILQAGGSASPFMDGNYLPHHPFDPGAPLETADVPIMISTTLHDRALSLTNWGLDAGGLRGVIAQNFGEANADRIIAAQKAARPQDSPFLIQASALTDQGRARGVIVQAERKAALNKAPAYVYEWDWISDMADRKMGAIHGLDVSASFNNARDATMSAGNARGRTVAWKFSSTFAAFAKTGNPNNPEVPNWPAYNPQTRPTLVWDDNIRVVNNHRGDLIAMADAARPPAGAGRRG
jgi:para-nitrobenzyl esterase